MRLILLSVITTLILSSCMVFHSGNISSGPLLNVNDQYVTIAKGESEAIIFLGIGGEFSNAMLLEAKKDMYLTRPLKKGEYYANITCDFCKKLILFGLVYSTKITVSADVMMSNNSSGEPFSLEYSKLFTPFVSPENVNVAKDTSKYNGSQLLPGDTVMYTYKELPYQQYVVSSLDKETVILKASGPGYPTILVPLKQNTFYIQNRVVNGLSKGSDVVIEIAETPEGKKNGIPAKVSGFCNNYVLANSGFGYLVQKLDRIKK